MKFFRTNGTVFVQDVDYQHQLPVHFEVCETVHKPQRFYAPDTLVYCGDVVLPVIEIRSFDLWRFELKTLWGLKWNACYIEHGTPPEIISLIGNQLFGEETSQRHHHVSGSKYWANVKALVQTLDREME